MTFNIFGKPDNKPLLLIPDKDLVNVIWAMGQMYPQGFTLDINTLQQPTTHTTLPFFTS